MRPLFLLAAGLAAMLAGCANSPAPNKYKQLESASVLARTEAGPDRHTAFAYEAAGALARYRSVRLLPVRLYDGTDGQFGTLSDADKAQLAAFADGAFRAAFARQGILAGPRAPDAVELRVTLTGAQASVPVLATATKLTPAGFALTSVNALAGNEGRFNGVIIYAVEFRDGASHAILWAFVTKQYPNALNIAATLGPLDAAKEGLKLGALDLAKATASRLKGG